MSDLIQRLSARDANELELARVAKLLGVNRSEAQLFAALDLTPNKVVPWEVLSDRIDYLYGDQDLDRIAMSGRLKRLRPALRRFSDKLQALARAGDPVPGPVEIRTHSRIGLELITPPEWLRRRRPPEKPLPDWTLREAMRSGLAIVVGVQGGKVLLRPGQRFLSLKSGRVQVEHEAETEEGEG